MDKFLLARLTGKDVPHMAIFLNDVQRKGKTPQQYGVNATFLPGHFKGYTVKLNPLDGVYYFDIRPNMQTEKILKDHIRTFDHFLFGDLGRLLDREAIVAQVIPRKPGKVSLQAVQPQAALHQGEVAGADSLHIRAAKTVLFDGNGAGEVYPLERQGDAGGAPTRGARGGPWFPRCKKARKRKGKGLIFCLSPPKHVLRTLQLNTQRQ